MYQGCYGRWPDGHYVRTLGNTGDKEAETDVLLVENDINTNPFTEAVYACVPPLPWDSAAQEVGVNGREDLRNELIFSVDPPGCKDIDDALHLKMVCTINPKPSTLNPKPYSRDPLRPNKSRHIF